MWERKSADPLWDMEGNSDTSVPQSTHPDLVSAHGYLPDSDLPNLNFS
jgi:hypothetical protein